MMLYSTPIGEIPVVDMKELRKEILSSEDNKAKTIFGEKGYDRFFRCRGEWNLRGTFKVDECRSDQGDSRAE
jgi:hypothetical protein